MAQSGFQSIRLKDLNAMNRSLGVVDQSGGIRLRTPDRDQAAVLSGHNQDMFWMVNNQFIDTCNFKVFKIQIRPAQS